MYYKDLEKGWEELLGDGEGLGWITRRWKWVGMD